MTTPPVRRAGSRPQCLRGVSDRDLVRELHRQHPAALEELDRRFRRPLLARAQSLLGRSGLDPEAAVQETLLTAWRRPPRDDRDLRLAAWLHRVLANAAHDQLRRRAVLPMAELTPGAAPLWAVHDDRDAVTARELTDALGRLPCRQARAVVMRDWEGRPYAEIAGRLATSEPAIKSLIHRGRRQLRTLLAAA